MQYLKDVDKHEGCDVEIGTLMFQSGLVEIDDLFYSVKKKNSQLFGKKL